MNIIEIIIKKRDGKELADDEIAALIAEYTAGTIPDYQMASLLMAVFKNGMSDRETASLTGAMMRSGHILDLRPVGYTVDKHSTGGVGDKTTLIVVPLAASLGLKVPTMFGRGLGHTGGTRDKLESIPGFRTVLSEPEIIGQLNTVGAVMIGTSEEIAPADRKLYALRDVTGTVESIPLITASILSKKCAEGTDALVLDVKTGSGAFMKDRAGSDKLARLLVSIAKLMGKKARAVLSSMDQPLGQAVGNTLEVIESIDVLRGNGPADVRELSLILCAHMLALA
ncbi:MAG TPA: thymidine phosphorylase, partial [bacterium]|nr:thymidine phosphorylase [bacterium]